MTVSQDSFLYDQVATMISALIDNGTLQAGDRVPSLRRMSTDLRVSISTVNQAYLTLEERGIIEARPQSGFYVRPRPRSAAAPPRISRPAARPRTVRLNDVVREIFSAAREPSITPLGLANLAPGLLPVKALARCTRQVAAREPHATLDYSATLGHPELRRQIALRASAHGHALAAGDVIVTTGATEALAVSLQAVARAGDVIAVESPTYFCVLQLIESLGMLALEIPTDPTTGMCLDSLEERLETGVVKAVITVANFGNPTGALMPAANKQRLVRMLARRGIALIDDDINGDLNHGDERPVTAKRFDDEGWVLSCSSFSKTIAPGYRIGWVVPGRFGAEVAKAKLVSTSACASLPQMAVAEFLHSGNYDRHLRRLRRTLSQQVERMRDAIGEQFPPGTRITRPRGGMVLWIELPRGVDSTDLFNQALARGVSITPGPLFSPSRKFRNYVRVACGHPWDERTALAVTTLADLVRSSCPAAQ